jgi:RNA-directed DNA polymerase
MMNGDGKSDSSIVPEKPPNKATQVAAEVVEGRELAKGNLPECNTPRTLSRTDVPSALRRVCQAARRDNKQRFTALLHHVYDSERLRVAYRALRREAAAGVDGGGTMARGWRKTFRISRSGSSGERTGPNRFVGHTY